MFTYIETEDYLAVLGQRIRAGRILRGDDQKTFAHRIGVTVPTLRNLEHGKSSVSIGAFMNALVAVGRVGDVTGVLDGITSERQRARRHSSHGEVSRAKS